MSRPAVQNVKYQAEKREPMPQKCYPAPDRRLAVAMLLRVTAVADFAHSQTHFSNCLMTGDWKTLSDGHISLERFVLASWRCDA